MTESHGVQSYQALFNISSTANHFLSNQTDSELRNGLPFDVAIPNETTHRTFDETDAGKNLTVCRDADDMFKKLGI